MMQNIILTLKKFLEVDIYCFSI